MRLVFIFFAWFFLFENSSEAKIPDAVSKTQTETKTAAQAAKERVQDLANRAFEIIRTTGITPAEVSLKFKELLKEYFAMDAIATFILGPYNGKFAENSQKDTFERCLENMLAKSYSSKFAEYTNAKFSVSDPVNKANAKQFLVSSAVSIPNKKDIKITWRLKNINDKWMITDVQIENISMQTTQKANVCGSIKKIGMEKFLQEFKEKYGQ
jgi:ABC-type transporter MlaC component